MVVGEELFTMLGCVNLTLTKALLGALAIGLQNIGVLLTSCVVYLVAVALVASFLTELLISKVVEPLRKPQLQVTATVEKLNGCMELFVRAMVLAIEAYRKAKLEGNEKEMDSLVSFAEEVDELAAEISFQSLQEAEEELKVIY